MWHAHSTWHSKRIDEKCLARGSRAWATVQQNKIPMRVLWTNFRFWALTFSFSQSTVILALSRHRYFPYLRWIYSHSTRNTLRSTIVAIFIAFGSLHQLTNRAIFDGRLICDLLPHARGIYDWHEWNGFHIKLLIERWLTYLANTSDCRSQLFGTSDAVHRRNAAPANREHPTNSLHPVLPQEITIYFIFDFLSGLMATSSLTQMDQTSCTAIAWRHRGEELAAGILFCPKTNLTDVRARIFLAISLWIWKVNSMFTKKIHWNDSSLTSQKSSEHSSLKLFSWFAWPERNIDWSPMKSTTLPNFIMERVTCLANEIDWHRLVYRKLICFASKIDWSPSFHIRLDKIVVLDMRLVNIDMALSAPY